jgi:hypothetical protein
MYAIVTLIMSLVTEWLCTLQNLPQGKQRVDEAPVVQTKAKMNQILSRGASTDFGMDSMFQSSRYVLVNNHRLKGSMSDAFPLFSLRIDNAKP